MKVLAHYLYQRWRRRHEKDEQATESDEEDHVGMEPITEEPASESDEEEHVGPEPVM